MQTLLNILAGVALLVWGTHIVRTGILRLYGSNLRRFLRVSVAKPPSAFFAGVGITALIQVAESGTNLRVVITDLHMPQMDGLSFVRVLKGRSPQTDIIVVSGRLDEREAVEFKKLGVSALLDKPFTQKKLVAALRTIFQK